MTGQSFIEQQRQLLKAAPVASKASKHQQKQEDSLIKQTADAAVQGGTAALTVLPGMANEIVANPLANLLNLAVEIATGSQLYDYDPFLTAREATEYLQTKAGQTYEHGPAEAAGEAAGGLASFMPVVKGAQAVGMAAGPIGNTLAKGATNFMNTVKSTAPSRLVAVEGASAAGAAGGNALASGTVMEAPAEVVGSMAGGLATGVPIAAKNALGSMFTGPKAREVTDAVDVLGPNAEGGYYPTTASDADGLLGRVGHMAGQTIPIASLPIQESNSQKAAFLKDSMQQVEGSLRGGPSAVSGKNTDVGADTAQIYRQAYNGLKNRISTKEESFWDRVGDTQVRVDDLPEALIDNAEHATKKDRSDLAGIGREVMESSYLRPEVQEALDSARRKVEATDEMLKALDYNSMIGFRYNEALPLSPEQRLAYNAKRDELNAKLVGSADEGAAALGLERFALKKQLSELADLERQQWRFMHPQTLKNIESRVGQRVGGTNDGISQYTNRQASDQIKARIKDTLEQIGMLDEYEAMKAQEAAYYAKGGPRSQGGDLEVLKQGSLDAAAGYKQLKRTLTDSDYVDLLMRNVDTRTSQRFMSNVIKYLTSPKAVEPSEDAAGGAMAALQQGASNVMDSLGSVEKSTLDFDAKEFVKRWDAMSEGAKNAMFKENKPVRDKMEAAVLLARQLNNNTGGEGVAAIKLGVAGASGLTALLMGNPGYLASMGLSYAAARGITKGLVSEALSDWALYHTGRSQTAAPHMITSMLSATRERE